MSRTPRARSHTSTPVQGEGACTWRAWRVGVQVVCERPLIGSTSACACVQTGRGGGGVARTSLPAALRRAPLRLQPLATVLPSYGHTLYSTILYTSTEDSNQSQSIPYFTFEYMHSTVHPYTLPRVRGILSTESYYTVHPVYTQSRTSVERAKLQHNLSVTGGTGTK